MMVGPTKVKPRFLRSLLIFSESGVDAGISSKVLKALSMGVWSTQLQR